MKIHVLIVACVLVVLAGCAEPSLAPSDASAAAKSISVPSGKACIYVYRPSGFYGAAVKEPIFLDTQLVGQPTVGTFLLLEVPPATYTLTSSNTNSQEVSFAVHSGEAVFFRVHGGFGGGLKYDRVSTTEGVSAIQTLQRVTSHFNPHPST